jgi:hypothetical protein
MNIKRNHITHKMTELQEKYDTLMSDWMKQFQNTKFIFEVTKCCGYSTFVMVNKRSTPIDLYREVSQWFECSTVQELYTISTQTGEKHTIPMTDMITIRDYIRNAPREFFNPVYPIPNKIVYRIYFDDGHKHPTCEECST